MRQAEQFGFKWQDIDLEGGLITLPDTKAGIVQYVHLNDEAKGILRRWQAVAEAEAITNPKKHSEWVYPSENRATPIDPRNFYIRVYLPAIEAAKLSEVTWHTLRHTFAYRLAMTGKAEVTIAALLRHSTTSLVKRYAHLSPSHLKAAVEDLTGFGKEPKAKVASTAPQTEASSNGTVTETGNVADSQTEDQGKCWKTWSGRGDLNP